MAAADKEDMTPDPLEEQTDEIVRRDVADGDEVPVEDHPDQSPTPQEPEVDA